VSKLLQQAQHDGFVLLLIMSVSDPSYTLPLLCAASLLAGLIDGMVGGGGLIQLPALLLLLPEVPVPTVLGTGKVASLAGTSASAFRYLRG
jgi:uncharacterized membrane protein YfcA